jgi:hypothetical protein
MGPSYSWACELPCSHGWLDMPARSISQALQFLLRKIPSKRIQVRYFDCAKIYKWWDEQAFQSLSSASSPSVTPMLSPAASSSSSPAASTSPFKQYVAHSLLQSLHYSGYQVGPDLSKVGSNLNTAWQQFLAERRKQFHPGGQSFPELYLFFDRTDEYCHTTVQADDFRAFIVELLNTPRIQVR